MALPLRHRHGPLHGYQSSTKLTQQYPDVMPNLLARRHQILNQSIQAQKGYVFQVVGDSFAVAFHSASDALYAALGAQPFLSSGIITL